MIRKISSAPQLCVTSSDKAAKIIPKSSKKKNRGKHNLANAHKDTIAKIDYEINETDKLFTICKTRRLVHNISKDSIIAMINMMIDNDKCHLKYNKKTKYEYLAINCPHTGNNNIACKNIIPLQRFYEVLTVEQQGLLTEKLTSTRMALYKSAGRLAYCPDPKCVGSGGIELPYISPGKKRPSLVTCINENCLKTWCMKCSISPFHEGMSCEHAKERQELYESTDPTIKFILDKYQLCPKCNMSVEKIDGCDHMTCFKQVGGCGAHFCWRCCSVLPEGGDMGGHIKFDEVLDEWICSI